MSFTIPNRLLAFFFVFITLSLNAQNKKYFVDTAKGLDTNPGTFSLPLQSITKAVGLAAAGDTVCLRGGKYTLSSKINLSKSGTAEKKYYLFAYENERPVLDFSSQSLGSQGISLTGSYWYIRGLDIKGAGDNGMAISGGAYNIIEFCSFYENRDTGLQLDNGANNNRVINCDSYFNADPPDYGDADGFAPKLTVGTGNYFYGCRAWGNCDDGWDGYMRGATDKTTTLENCWAFGNGYLKNGTDPGSQANGNGFKMGGSDDKTLMHNFILTNCLSFDNKVKGFDQNNNKGSMTLYNCTGYRNGTYNFSIPSGLTAGKTAIIKNSISLASQGVSLMSAVSQSNNTWNNPLTVSAADFESIDTTGVRGPRKPDGSLPEIKFMRLSPGSKLIDAGTDVGIPYNGKAPDLGAFESGTSTEIEEKNERPSSFTLSQNYPNPFNPSTIIQYTIPAVDKLRAEVHVWLKVYDMLGSEVATLVNETKLPGIYEVKFYTRDADLNRSMTSGVYFYTLKAGDFLSTKKMILLR